MITTALLLAAVRSRPSALFDIVNRTKDGPAFAVAAQGRS
jgi:hypothetical protein